MQGPDAVPAVGPRQTVEFGLLQGAADACGATTDACQQAVQLRLGEGHPTARQDVPEGGLAAVATDDDVPAGPTHVGGVEGLVTTRPAQHRLHVDAALVAEGGLPYDGTVGRDRPARHAGHVFAERAEHTGIGDVQSGRAPQRHHHLFERRVARPLAQSVDGHVDAVGAGLDGGQAVGRGHAEVVVTVEAQFEPVRDRPQGGERAVRLRGAPQPHRVGQAHPVRARAAGGGDDLGQERHVGARGVLRPHRDVCEPPGGVRHDIAQPVEHVGRRPAEKLHVQRPGRHGDVYGVDAAERGQVHVVPARPAPGGQPHGQAEVGHRPDGPPLVLPHGRDAHLQLTDPAARQHDGQAQTVAGGEHHAGRLLAVAQRGVHQVWPHGCVRHRTALSR